MAKKILFQTALTELATSDVEGLSVERDDEWGRTHRWVKNASATALIAEGCCLQKPTSLAGDALKYVLSPNAFVTGPITGMITMPAGVPISGIGASGASTGDYGWIMTKGAKRVSIRQSVLDTTQQAGCAAIATTVCVTYSEWDAAVTSVVDSTIAVAAGRYTFGITLLQKVLETGVATVASALALVNCP